MSEKLQETVDWIMRWQKIARRIRVPLGFLCAVLYLFELVRHQSTLAMIAWSLLLTVPGVWLRGYAAGYVKKNQELTTTGPYAHTRNPLYLGSLLMAAGLATALGSWVVVVVLMVVFLAIYIPVILSEERFLRSTFTNFDAYCERVPRLIPRPRRRGDKSATGEEKEQNIGAFNWSLYVKHREYRAAFGALLLYVSLIFLAPWAHELWSGWTR